MRLFVTLVFLLFAPAAAPPATAQEPIPDLSERVATLQERFAALAERLAAMEGRREAPGPDARLGELFLPESPEAFRRQFRLELKIARNEGAVTDWLALARRWLEQGRLEDAEAAGFEVFRSARLDRRRAEGLRIMAEAAIGRGEPEAALPLYRESLALHEDEDAVLRLARLEERYELTLADVALDVERAAPSACLVFSQSLRKPLPLEPGDYLEIAPPADLDIAQSGKRLCLNGLEHGGRYRVRVKAGLPGAQEAVLRADQRREIVVPDRAARVGFRAATYLLPMGGPEGERLPLTSVNVERAALRLYRINDRNLVTAVVAGSVERDLDRWSERELAETSGALVWQGELEIDGRRNREATTLVPLEGLLGDRSAGVFALVARPANLPESEAWRPQATQWLVVSDLGLTSFEGADGLHVLVRSLDSAGARAGARLTLIARNNAVLGTATSDAEGLARFAPGLIRGTGGNRPALLTAEGPEGGEGDFSFLRLVGPALDLSERGVAGRQAPGELDAYLYAERGVYRPGETVKLGVLLRDGAARAVGGRPLTVTVTRPGGAELFRATATGDPLGGYGFEVPLSTASIPGTWTATAFLDSADRPLGTTRFQVEDFAPQRIAVELTPEAPALEPKAAVAVGIAGRFLYGPPAAGLKTAAAVVVDVAETPFAGYEDYRFGLEQESYRPERLSLDTPETDAAGESRLTVALDPLPESSHPLEARIEASVFDVGGRPVTARLSLPIRARPVELGLRAPGGGRFAEGRPATVEIVALDPAGQRVGGRRVAYEWVREHHDYTWYQSGNAWQVRTQVLDEPLAAGELTLDVEGRGRLERRLEPGRYRLDAFDPEGSAETSHRLTVGWWATAQLPDVPDALELSLERDDLGVGETLSAFVRAPFAGQAFVAVVGDRLHHHASVALPAEGARIELPVEADWGPGAYLLVTAFRPEAGKPSLLPVRAMGLAWVSIGRAARSLEVALEAPEVVRPRQSLVLPVRVTGAAPGAPLRLTLAAVDEGILQLTGYRTPDPSAHFLGQRSLGLALRDLYGHLIRPAEGSLGRLRGGGDTANLQNLAGIDTRSTRAVALFERDIEPDAEGRAEVELEIPDFTGRLRLMAVAYGAEAVGAGEADLIVRDPVAAEVALPRFLAPGDRAMARVSLHNLTGGPAALRVALEAGGGLLVDALEPIEVALAEDERRALAVELTASAVGDGHLALRVEGDDLEPIERDWDLAIRPAQPTTSERSVTTLAAGAQASIGGDRLVGYLPGTATLGLTVTDRPDFDVPGLLGSLYRYPYGCTEQAVSVALPLLYLGAVAERWGAEFDPLTLRRRVEHAVLQVLNRQGHDGAFSAWRASDRPHPWLSAYVADFLTRARELGYRVPEVAYAHAVTWLRRSLAERRGGYAEAYALYVLARIGEASPGEVRYYAETFAERIETRLGLGQVAAALALVGERGRAEALFERAIGKRRPAGGGIHDYGSDLRDGAALLALLAEAFPGDARGHALTEALERRFDRERWLSTQDQAWLLLATHALSAGAGTGLDLALDGEAVEPQAGALRLSLASEDLTTPLILENRGAGALRVIASLRGVPVDPLPPAEQGFRISRQVLTPEGARADLTAVAQNDLLIVVIEGEALDAGAEHEALIVDLLPAGFEIENTALGGAGEKAAYGFLPELSPFAYEAARDDRYVAAIDLDSRRRSFAAAYVVRAVTPGQYMHPGVFVEDMYEPRYHARGPVGLLEVAAR